MIVSGSVHIYANRTVLFFLWLSNSPSFTCLFSHSIISDSFQPHGLQHARLPCPSPTSGACSNSCSSNQWCHPTISSSLVLLSYCLWSFLVPGSFPINQYCASRGQSIGASATSPSNEYSGMISFRMTGLISLLSKGLSRVFSKTTVQKHQFFSAQLSFFKMTVRAGCAVSACSSLTPSLKTLVSWLSGERSRF